MKKGWKRSYLVNILQSYPYILAKPEQMRTKNEQRRADSVQHTLDHIRQTRDGADKLRLAELLYFRGQYNLPGAARALYVSERVLYKWNDEILRTLERYADIF